MPNRTSAIGIMSGTSVDAIDAVLLEVTDRTRPVLLSSCSRPFPGDLRQKIVRLSTPGENEIELAGSVHTELGELYADVANSLKQESCDTHVTVIGCHGQTVRHRPNEKHPFTLQLGNGAVIAQRTGIDTVTDFRSADMALGGQGAPFAPFFHSAVFSAPDQSRAIVNLGGIANVTILPTAPDTPVIGFDTGPANGLMDTWIQKHQGHHYDRDGAWGRTGKLNNRLLELCLSEPYFKMPPPKSTGKELFNIEWIERHLDRFGTSVSPVDVQSTLGALTAQSLANQLPKDLDAIYVCGGGALNPWLLELIQNLVSVKVKTTEALGFPPQWIEAAAFAWMAAATIDKRHCTIPSVTGASGSSVAGSVYYA